MSVTVYAVGKLKRGPETELVTRYQTRLKRLKTTLREFPERESKVREGADLLAALPGILLGLATYFVRAQGAKSKIPFTRLVGGADR